jgi:tetratricopeptide (TPR) repeat protein
MYVPEGRPLFRRQSRRSSPYRIYLLLIMLVGSLFVYRGWASGQVEPLFLPTPTPTRIPYSYVLEAQTRFEAGDLKGAIEAYQRAIELDPQNAELLAELARLQTYASTLETSDTGKSAVLTSALENIDRAVELNPDSSLVHAVRAFVLDWNANPLLVSAEERDKLLNEADQSAIRAIDLDRNNALALAYYAEIQADQFRLQDAEQTIQFAIEADPNLMDVHRVSAYVQESNGRYSDAIGEYEKALAITPNLTYLHMMIGYNYRTIAGGMVKWEERQQQTYMYELALNAFARVVDINKQLGIKDPIPYVAIAKTYAQQGEFLISSLNILTALEYAPNDPAMYGEAGIIFYKARNYETSELALTCAVRGCDADISCEVRQCNRETDPPIEIQGLPLSDGSKWYYIHYGSVKAALHRKTDLKCPDALEAFGEIRSAYSNDTLLMSIVKVGEDTCDFFGYR